MQKIPLRNRKNEIIAESTVDETNYEMLMLHKWHLKDGYAETILCNNVKHKNIKMHHLVIGKPPKGLVTDHIDRNPLNNQKSNLRFVTQRINLLNKKVYGAVPFKGIYKNHNSYVAKININKKLIHLGSGKNPRELYEKYFVPAYLKQYGMYPVEEIKIGVR